MGSLTAVSLWFSYRTLHSRFGPDALTPLCWGTACFLIGVLISALKGGLWPRLRTRLIRAGLLRGGGRGEELVKDAYSSR